MNMKEKFIEFFKPHDMTVGKPWLNLVQFSVPLLIGNFVQQLYNTVDSIVVGKYVGDNALAAVGASGPLLNLLLVLFMGIATGAGILVSQYFGAREKELLSHTVGTTLTLTLIATGIIMVIGPLLTPPLMSLLDTPPEIYDMACSYLTIFFLGSVGFAFYNMISGILRGLGDSFMPLVFLMLACGLNIVLDILFVAAFNWGVPGVAWATIIAQFISAVFCMMRLLRLKRLVTINRNTLRPTKILSGKVIKLGLPAGLTQAIFSMAAIIVQSLTNSFGTLVIAMNTVVMRVDGFAVMPNFTFGNAMTTYSGQNVGAGQLDRVHEGTRSAMKMGLGVSAVLVVLILLFGEGLMRMFTDTAEVVSLGVHMMRILAVGYVAMAITQILSGVMRGAGDTMTPMWISLITTVVIRVPLAYGLAYLTRSETQPQGSPDSLFISMMISWVLGAVITIFAFRFGKWRKKALLSYPSAVREPAAETVEAAEG